MTTSNSQQTLNLGLVCALVSASVPSEFVKWPPPIPPTHTATLSWEFRLKRRSGQCSGCSYARPLLICQRTNAYFLTLYACVISLSQYQLFLFDLMLCSIELTFISSLVLAMQNLSHCHEYPPMSSFSIFHLSVSLGNDASGKSSMRCLVLSRGKFK